MEKRKVQQAVAEWEAEKRQRIEDGEEGVEGDADEEDVQDVQVQYMHLPGTSMIQPTAVLPLSGGTCMLLATKVTTRSISPSVSEARAAVRVTVVVAVIVVTCAHRQI